MDLLPEGGPKSGLLSNTRKQIVREDACPYKAKDYWKGHPGREQWDEGTQEGVPSSWAEGSSASWCAVSVFMVMGLALPGCLWPVILLVPTFGLTRVLPDGARFSLPREDFWEVVRTYYGLVTPLSFWPLPDFPG